MLTQAREEDETHLRARWQDLASVGGETGRDNLLDRFTSQLVILSDPQAEQNLPVHAHRLAGVAGMLGFAALERACRELEDEPGDFERAVRLQAAMRSAIARLGRR